MIDLFRQFYARNKVTPEAVFFYRDGVSEGQFQEVLEHEYSEIKKVRSSNLIDIAFIGYSVSRHATLSLQNTIRQSLWWLYKNHIILDYFRHIHKTETTKETFVQVPLWIRTSRQNTNLISISILTVEFKVSISIMTLLNDGCQAQTNPPIITCWWMRMGLVPTESNC